jgi:hypothetical protein
MIEEFKEYLNKQNDHFLEAIDKSMDQYSQIWKYYEEKMGNESRPGCIKSCKKTLAEEFEQEHINGPMGIYWIGKESTILFVGKENYGWMDSKEFNKDNVCFSALNFAYQTIESMSGYWNKVKWIVTDVIKAIKNQTEVSHDEMMDFISITNLSKCYSPYKTVQNKFYTNCFNQNYLQKEIEIIQPKIVVMFTLNSSIIDKLNLQEIDSPKSVDIHNQKIYKRIIGDTIFYELNHPGRMNNEIIEKLIKSIQDDLRK